MTLPPGLLEWVKKNADILEELRLLERDYAHGRVHLYLVDGRFTHYDVMNCKRKERELPLD